jgi:hypothetical protein
MLQRTAFILSVFLAANFLPAQDRQGNALAVFDAWLAQAAANNIIYRTDFQTGGDPAAIGPGRAFGRSALLGGFTYRPKTYRDLTRSERAAMLADPKFRTFLIAVREQCDGGTGQEPECTDGRDPAQFFPTAAEMLRPSTVCLVPPP